MLLIEDAEMPPTETTYPTSKKRAVIVPFIVVFLSLCISCRSVPIFDSSFAALRLRITGVTVQYGRNGWHVGVPPHLPAGDFLKGNHFLLERLSRHHILSLYLHDTDVTDGDLIFLKNIHNTFIIDVSRTSITDKGLMTLSGLKRIVVVIVVDSRVTKKGFLEFLDILGEPTPDNLEELVNSKPNKSVRTNPIQRPFISGDE